MESKFLRRGARRPDVRLLHGVIAKTPGQASPAILAGIQNPCPVGARDINTLPPKRRAKLGRKLVQHGQKRVADGEGNVDAVSMPTAAKR